MSPPCLPPLFLMLMGFITPRSNATSPRCILSFCSWAVHLTVSLKAGPSEPQVSLWVQHIPGLWRAEEMALELGCEV